MRNFPYHLSLQCSWKLSLQLVFALTLLARSAIEGTNANQGPLALFRLMSNAKESTCDQIPDHTHPNIDCFSEQGQIPRVINSLQTAIQALDNSLFLTFDLQQTSAIYRQLHKAKSFPANSLKLNFAIIGDALLDYATEIHQIFSNNWYSQQPLFAVSAFWQLDSLILQSRCEKITQIIVNYRYSMLKAISKHPAFTQAKCLVSHPSKSVLVKLEAQGVDYRLAYSAENDPGFPFKIKLLNRNIREQAEDIYLYPMASSLLFVLYAELLMPNPIGGYYFRLMIRHLPFISGTAIHQVIAHNVHDESCAHPHISKIFNKLSPLFSNQKWKEILLIFLKVHPNSRIFNLLSNRQKYLVDSRLLADNQIFIESIYSTHSLPKMMTHKKEYPCIHFGTNFYGQESFTGKIESSSLMGVTFLELQPCASCLNNIFLHILDFRRKPSLRIFSSQLYTLEEIDWWELEDKDIESICLSLFNPEFVSLIVSPFPNSRLINKFVQSNNLVSSLPIPGFSRKITMKKDLDVKTYCSSLRQLMVQQIRYLAIMCEHSKIQTKLNQVYNFHKLGKSLNERVICDMQMNFDDYLYFTEAFIRQSKFGVVSFLKPLAFWLQQIQLSAVHKRSIAEYIVALVSIQSSNPYSFVSAFDPLILNATGHFPMLNYDSETLDQSNVLHQKVRTLIRSLDQSVTVKSLKEITELAPQDQLEVLWHLVASDRLCPSFSNATLLLDNFTSGQIRRMFSCASSSFRVRFAEEFLQSASTAHSPLSFSFFLVKDPVIPLNSCPMIKENRITNFLALKICSKLDEVFDSQSLLYLDYPLELLRALIDDSDISHIDKEYKRNFTKIRLLALEYLEYSLDTSSLLDRSSIVHKFLVGLFDKYLNSSCGLRSMKTLIETTRQAIGDKVAILGDDEFFAKDVNVKKLLTECEMYFQISSFWKNRSFEMRYMEHMLLIKICLSKVHKSVPISKPKPKIISATVGVNSKLWNKDKEKILNSSFNSKSLGSPSPKPSKSNLAESTESDSKRPKIENEDRFHTQNKNKPAKEESREESKPKILIVLKNDGSRSEVAEVIPKEENKVLDIISQESTKIQSAFDPASIFKFDTRGFALPQAKTGKANINLLVQHLSSNDGLDFKLHPEFYNFLCNSGTRKEKYWQQFSFLESSCSKIQWRPKSRGFVCIGFDEEELTKIDPLSIHQLLSLLYYSSTERTFETSSSVKIEVKRTKDSIPSVEKGYLIINGKSSITDQIAYILKPLTSNNPSPPTDSPRDSNFLSQSKSINNYKTEEPCTVSKPRGSYKTKRMSKASIENQNRRIETNNRGVLHGPIKSSPNECMIISSSPSKTRKDSTTKVNSSRVDQKHATPTKDKEIANQCEIEEVANKAPSSKGKPRPISKGTECTKPFDTPVVSIMQKSQVQRAALSEQNQSNILPRKSSKVSPSKVALTSDSSEKSHEPMIKVGEKLKLDEDTEMNIVSSINFVLQETFTVDDIKSSSNEGSSEDTDAPVFPKSAELSNSFANSEDSSISSYSINSSPMIFPNIQRTTIEKLNTSSSPNSDPIIGNQSQQRFDFSSDCNRYQPKGVRNLGLVHNYSSRFSYKSSKAVLRPGTLPSSRIIHDKFLYCTDDYNMKILELKNDLSMCSYVAFDLEMTGLYVNYPRTFKTLLEGANAHQVIEIGLSLIFMSPWQSIVKIVNWSIPVGPNRNLGTKDFDPSALTALQESGFSIASYNLRKVNDEIFISNLLPLLFGKLFIVHNGVADFLFLLKYRIPIEYFQDKTSLIQYININFGSFFDTRFWKVNIDKESLNDGRSSLKIAFQDIFGQPLCGVHSASVDAFACGMIAIYAFNNTTTPCIYNAFI